MTASRSRVLVTTLLAGASAVVLGATVAPALTVRATPKHITPAGVGAVKLGATYQHLRAAHLIGPIAPGCELGGPNTRSARLRAPLKGGVDFTLTTPRKVTAITITGGATARGVGIGATPAQIKSAFPKVVADHSGDKTFLLTFYKVPKSGGGKLIFGVDTTTHKVTTIGIPFIPICD